MAAAKSAKNAKTKKAHHARSASGNPSDGGTTCARKSRGLPIVARMDGDGPIVDEPQTPPMPGPGGGHGHEATGTCATCATVPFSGSMTIAILSVMAISLAFAALLLTHVNQLQAAQLHASQTQVELANQLNQIK